MIYVYSDGKTFVRIKKDIRFSITKDINKATTWTSKKHAKSWNRWINSNNPNMSLKETSLILIS